MTDDGIRELLREMRDDVVPADSLARVRARVEERTGAGRRRWWLVLVFAAVLAMVFWPYRPEQPVVKVAREVPVITPPAPKPAAVVAKPARVAKRLPKPAAEASTIRIETPDPNVVLIFVTGGAEDRLLARAAQ